MFTGKSITSYIANHSVTDYITLNEVKRQNNIGTSDTTFDNELQVYLEAAFDQVDTWVGYSTRKCNVKYGFSDLLDGGLIRLYTKVNSITSVNYLDNTETEQSIEAIYKAFNSLGLTIVVTGSAETLSKSETKYVVNLVEGFDKASAEVNEGLKFPSGLKAAILMLTSVYFTNRQPVAFGGNPTEIPLMYQSLVSPYQIIKIT